MPSRATRSVAVVSVDLDSLDAHLRGYGVPDPASAPLVLTRALPRLLELFARAGIRSTLFAIGRDAGPHAGLFAEAARAGHEIASHTWSHPARFARLPPERRRAEMVDSRRALEDAIAGPVVGFRAPNFDLHRCAVPELVAAGYRYDASAYPSPVLILARGLLAWKNLERGRLPGSALWPFTWRRTPHDWSVGGATIREFPLAVTPGLRLPVYHTLRYYSSERAWSGRLDGFARRGEVLSYALHGVDALGLHEDGVDRRMARHPGMLRSLEEKLHLLEATLRLIAERFESRPYRELLG